MLTISQSLWNKFGKSLHIEFERVSFFNKWKYCHRALLHYSITAGSRPSYNGCCDRQQFIHSFRMQHHQLLQNGAPLLDPLTDAINSRCPQMNIQPALGESDSQSLEYLQQSTVRRTLGCYKCPSGNSKTGLQAIRQNAMEKSQIVLNSHLDARATYTYYFAVLLPSLSYSLPVSHYSSKSLDRPS
jgi:hypothetical protein